MADISKCKGESAEGFICPKRDSCYRYTAPNSMMQSYFTTMPWFNKKCDYYWSNKDYVKNERNVQRND